MAVSNNKESRNITVRGFAFRWRATGNGGWISVVVWPVSNPSCRVVGKLGYHVVTNRLIRRIVLHFGVDYLVENHGQIDAGAFEDLIYISDAVHAE